MERNSANSSENLFRQMKIFFISAIGTAMVSLSMN
jgi:hypothetical protein